MNVVGTNDNQFQKKTAKRNFILPTELKDNLIVFEINDIDIFNIYELFFNITLPEIKGEGSVAYIKNHESLIIKNIKIILINPNNTSYNFIDMNSSEINEKLKKNFKSKENIYNFQCEEKFGENLDDIIFEKYDLEIPIIIQGFSLRIYPETKVRIEIIIEDFINLLTYNKLFKEKSLNTLQKFANNTPRNYSMTFLNDYNYKRNNVTYYIKTFSESNNKTSVFTSQTFSNTNEITIYSKMKHFNSQYTFLFNPGSDLSEKVIINKFIDNFKDDLLLIVPIGEEPSGHDRRNIYIKMENGKIQFNKNHKCYILIHNLPKDKDVYFHSNILSYERRHDEVNKINISHLFKRIEGIYINSEKILFEKIDHDIKVIHASIPLEFWKDKTNTSTGDRRSIKSKSKDFIYSNPLITGLDFSSRNEFISKIETSIYNINHKFKMVKDSLSNYLSHIDICNKETYFSLFLLINNIIYSDPSHGLSNFFFQIYWKEYSSSSIYELFIPSVICEILEYRKIIYDNGNVEITDRIDNQAQINFD